MSRQVELKTYDPEWLRQFEVEAERLTAVFQPNFVAIHHVGSTAVPGIKAKPIIDIMVVVRDIEQVDTINETMGQLGYIAKGENGIDGRRYFRKGSDAVHTHHIHTFQDGHPEIARHLSFRDYLIAHPIVAQAYSRLKEDLAQRYKTEPPHYTNSKTDFIHEVDQKAAVWRNHRPIATARLHLHPLTMAQLQTGLDDTARLAQELGISLADDLFTGTVRQPIKKKLEIMADLAEADHPWATYWLIVPKVMGLGIGMAGFKGY
ncbi:MAG: GrpB family protein, partial [Anaerolineales bacterium]|nr:GrpB family protein [Anaerolineales bacterium]